MTSNIQFKVIWVGKIQVELEENPLFVHWCGRIKWQIQSLSMLAHLIILLCKLFEKNLLNISKKYVEDFV